jgi:hypothetical protein
MNTARKGRRLEHKSRKIYEGLGFSVTRSAGSKGPWDLIAMGEHNIVIIQVRAGRWPSKKEQAELAAVRAPTKVIRELHRWRPRARRPDIKCLIDGEWRDQEWLLD